MSRRLAWSLWAASVAFTGGGLGLFSLEGAGAGRSSSGIADPYLALAFLSFSTIGAFLASRLPRNPIGWIFAIAGLVIATQALAFEYADYALARQPTPLPGATFAAWLQTWVWTPAVGLTGTLLLLLFPDGRLPSRRWRSAVWLAVAATAFHAFTRATAPGSLESFPGIENAFGLGRPGGIVDTLVKANAGDLAVLGAVLVSVASLVVRSRRAGVEERQQLKWFVYATVFFGFSSLITAATDGALVGWGLWIAAVIALPVATGIAISRYRLYEIDLIIRRTLVYGVLSAGLAGLYLGVVLALEQVFAPVTEGSDLAIAGSTLAVAALFRPARRRIQELVDRRFYRRKVDAERTLEGFAARLRREIDLDSLTAELSAAVRHTMQPASVSVWLRSGEAGR